MRFLSFFLKTQRHRKLSYGRGIMLTFLAPRDRWLHETEIFDNTFFEKIISMLNSLANAIAPIFP